jgi:hypothetical protein
MIDGATDGAPVGPVANGGNMGGDVGDESVGDVGAQPDPLPVPEPRPLPLHTGAVPPVHCPHDAQTAVAARLVATSRSAQN